MREGQLCEDLTKRRTILTVAFLIYFKTPEVPFTLHPPKKLYDQIGLIHRAKSHEP